MRWLAALAAILALVAVGCGSSDDDGGDEGTSTAAASGDGGGGAENASAPVCDGEEIRFQLSFFPNAQHTGYLVADSRDFYGDAGVSVKTIPGGPTVNPSLQLAQGNVDAVTTDDAILKGYAAQKPDKLKVVGKPFSEEKYGIGLPKDDKALRDYVNDQLQAAFDDGTWQKIYDATLGKSGASAKPPAIERY